MKKALRSLRIRLAFICVMTTGILLCAMAVMLLWISENQMDTQRELSFRNSANSIIYRLQTGNIIDDAWLSQIEAAGRLIVHIEDNSLPILFRGSWSPTTTRDELVRLAREKALSDYSFDANAKPRSVLTPEDVTFEIRGSQNEQYIVLLSLIPSEQGRKSLILMKDLAGDLNTIFLLRVSFFAVIFISLVLLLIFSLVFSRRATLQIEVSNKKHVEFVAAASHELRAPLTIVKAGLAEIAKEKSIDSALKYQTIANREISRMARLIDELLLLANADARELPLNTGIVDFDTLLTELYENYQMLTAARNQSISLSLPDYSLPMIQGDKQRLSQALTALLDNAVCYTPANGHIGIAATKYKRSLLIHISDTGIGVPDAEKGRIFERFYRSDASHTDKAHYGLGLSVAQEIVELHGGKITVSDSSGGGAVFSVKLPVLFF